MVDRNIHRARSSRLARMSRFTLMAAASALTLAPAASAQTSGSIVAWGAGGCGQSEGQHYGQSCLPEPNTGFVDLAAGYCHTLGLQADGSIVAWGAGACGTSEGPQP